MNNLKGKTMKQLLTATLTALLGSTVQAATFTGTNGNDTLYYDKQGTMGQATQWRDDVWGYRGSDTLIVGPGNDRVWGGDDRDIIQGWQGNDRLYGEDGSDIMSGGDGRDRMYGGDGDDYMYGGNHDDWLYGQGGNDRLYGNGGNDYLHGGDGWNVIVQSFEDLTDDVPEDLLPEDYEAEGPVLDGGKGDDTIVFRLRQPINVRGGAGNDKFIVKGRVATKHRVTVTDLGQNAALVFNDLYEHEVTVSENNGTLEFSVNGGATPQVFLTYSSPDIPGLNTLKVHGGLSSALQSYGLTLVFAE